MFNSLPVSIRRIPGSLEQQPCRCYYFFLRELAVVPFYSVPFTIWHFYLSILPPFTSSGTKYAIRGEGSSPSAFVVLNDYMPQTHIFLPIHTLHSFPVCENGMLCVFFSVKTLILLPEAISRRVEKFRLYICRVVLENGIKGWLWLVRTGW